MIDQRRHPVRVTSPVGDIELLFHSLLGREQLGRLSEFTVQLLSTATELEARQLLGKPLSISVTLEDGSTRYFHGIVTRFSNVGWLGEYARYEVMVHAWLWLLKRSSTCRIFQEKTVLQVVSEVCSNDIYAGFSVLSTQQLSNIYPVLPYCVQYRETDFDFVCRLLEDAGIYFFFHHEKDRHVLVLADSYSAHPPIPGYQQLKFAGDRHGNALREESVAEWAMASEIAASSYVLNDFDDEKTSSSINGGLLSKARLTTSAELPAFELFDFPGKYTSADAGNVQALARMERAHGQSQVINARSDAKGLYPGGLFTLCDHPRQDQNGSYLVTAADYTVQGSVYTSQPDSASPTFYCTFSAVGKHHAFRPECSIAKPVVPGPQTAMVVGNGGDDQEIWTDAFGRIKVRFHWDRRITEDDKSTCWIRVAHSWAAKGWGAQFIPRVGMEVVVSFLEGDPDRPLVTGCVYNSDALMPYELPKSQTQSGFKTRSTPNGSGFNELRFEDQAGKEEVFIHAEKDFNRVVKHNDTLTVSGDQKITVDKTIVITSTTSIELVVGSSTIKLEPDKITILSTMVEIN